MRRTSPARKAAQESSTAIWYGVLAPPVVWSAHLLICYLLVSIGCAAGEAWMRTFIVGLTAAAEAAIVAAALLAYPQCPGAGLLRFRERDDQRTCFMAYLAMLESVVFFIATLFTAAPAFALHVCG